MSDRENDKKNQFGKLVDYNPFRDGVIQLAIATTESQREIIASIKLDPESSLAFNEVISIDLNGHLDELSLRNAIEILYKRHDVLRCVFSGDGKNLLLKQEQILPYRSLRVNSSSEIIDIESKEVATPFDLVNGPCSRWVLLKINENHNKLLFSVHHAICDGWSIAILLSELSSIYNTSRAPEAPADSFLSFATSETENLPFEDRNYWRDEFKKIPPYLYLEDKLRPEFRTYTSKRIDFAIPEKISDCIRSLSAKHGSSLYTVLMAGFSWKIAQISQQNNFVIGMASAAQANLGKPNLIGHLVNILPLNIEILSGTSFDQHLNLTRGKMLDAFEHPFLSFGKLLQDLNLTRDPKCIPLVNVVFNIDQQQPNQGLSFKGIKGRYITIPRVAENFELFVNVVSCEKNIVIECQYNTNLFTEEFINNFFQDYIESFLSIESAHLKLEAKVPTQNKLASKIEPTAQVDTEACALICDVWKKILNVNVLPDSNFFSSGGHSLLAIEVAQGLSQIFEKNIKPKHLFIAPTPASLAQLLSSLESIVTQPHKNEVAPVREEIFSLSYSQWQAWYLDEINPRSTMHNLPACIRLKIDIDKNCLLESLRFLISRHDMLRTKLVREGKEIKQNVTTISEALAGFNLSFVECREAELAEKLAKESTFVFEKSRAPLFKATLFKLGENDYAFFFMVHHIIWDGWSFDVFFKELDEVYSSLIRGLAPKLGEIKASYYSFTKKGYSEELTGEKRFWHEQLKSPLPLLDWKGQKDRPSRVSHQGEAFNFVLNEKVTTSLQDYVRKNGITLYNVFFTAFSRLVAEMTEETDIIIGMPSRNRNSVNELDVIGFFVNTLAIRLNINMAESFDETRRKVDKALVEALDHQAYPFARLLREINYPKSPSRTPVFQTFFSYQDVTNRKSSFNGSLYTQINVDKSSTHTDLDVWIKTSSSKIEGAFEYRLDLFERKTIESYFDRFLEILSQVIVPGESKDFVSISSLIKQWAQASPLSVAVKSEKGSLIYADLDLKSTKLAVALQDRGIGPRDILGVSMNRSIEMLIVLLAINKVGAAYVPLDPYFPINRLEKMIQISNPKMLLTDEANSKRFAQSVLFSSLHSANDELKPVNLKPKDPMYVIFTSGSTGEPKGVEVSFSSVLNFLFSMKKNPGFVESDKLLAVTTLSFDIAVLELYLPLICGGSVFVADPSQIVDGHEIAQLIEREGITVLQATPATWKLLYASGWQGKNDLKVLCGGEAIPKDLAGRLIRDTAEVWNMYGPTETTVWSTCKKLITEDEINIGSPINETQIYVLDENKKILNPGEIGELHIGGAGLANGYFAREEMTKEKFFKHPTIGKRLYATGDLARQTKNGEWECLGRIDGQVKIRGYRIELEEIEVVLRKQAGISDAVVRIQEVKPGDLRIVAYLVGKFDEQFLKSEIAKDLPPYMHPAHYMKLESIPLTPNGKVDRKSLPLISISEKKSTSKDIRKIWQDVLGVTHIKSSDDFFELGGHSLMAVELIATINETFDLSIALVDLIEHSEFGAFVSHVFGENNEDIKFKHIVKISLEGNGSPVFCIHGVGGNVMNYHTLIPALKGKRPLYGIQSQGLDGNSPFLKTIEEMASSYIEEIKLIQPQGPYTLAGGSMGGLVAFEVASQLGATGDIVEKLILLDTFGPDVNIAVPNPDEVSIIKRIIPAIKHRLKRMISWFRNNYYQNKGGPLPLDLLLFNLECQNFQAIYSYKPTSYSGDIYLFRVPLAKSGWYSDPYMGWRKVIKGNIYIFELEGEHSSFIEAPQLNSKLSQVL
ncbi:MAG: amino acid adenylation domain-containing protein [Bacteriovoracaceae bacterium]|nr:amino acid adenylation domain-containing protein [Bacteriovoracaceae bacterium]